MPNFIDGVTDSFGHMRIVRKGLLGKRVLDLCPVIEQGYPDILLFSELVG